MSRLPFFASPGEWVRDAECARRLDVSFELPSITDQSRNARIAAARSVCSVCPVLLPCTSWVLQEPDPLVGFVAAGMTPGERHQARWGRVG